MTGKGTVRRYVLHRAAGVCEFCGAAGFPMADGEKYLECHHVQGLAEGGSDTVDNVIALCPNDHRRAHFGADAPELSRQMLRRIGERNREAARNLDAA